MTVGLTMSNKLSSPSRPLIYCLFVLLFSLGVFLFTSMDTPVDIAAGKVPAHIAFAFTFT